MYRFENLVDEFVIAFLSFGFVAVSIWAVFYQNVGMVTLGQDIVAPWLGTLSLMLIARELWFINRNLNGGEN